MGKEVRDLLWLHAAPGGSMSGLLLLPRQHKKSYLVGCCAFVFQAKQNVCFCFYASTCCFGYYGSEKCLQMKYSVTPHLFYLSQVISSSKNALLLDLS